MNASSLAEIAALLGDAARANMLTSLLDGRAQTATELAYVAGVQAATASGHLAKLVDGRILTVTKQGRNRYFRLASREVAQMLEGVMVVAAAEQPKAVRRVTPRISPELREARTCYDHLAGRLGVGLADALTVRRFIELGEEAGEVTAAGAAWLAEFGVPPERTGRTRRLFCRPCLDWSERRPHLAGTLGAVLCSRCQDLGWIRRKPDSRALTITPAGRSGFASVFGISFES